MGSERRPLARLRKFHKGKRGISQSQSHLANLHRELRGETRRPEATEDGFGLMDVGGSTGMGAKVRKLPGTEVEGD